MKSLSLAGFFSVCLLLCCGNLWAQAEVEIHLNTSLPVSMSWRHDVLGLDHRTIDLPENARTLSLDVPESVRVFNGDARLFVQAGDQSRLFLIRQGFQYRITASDTAIAVQGTDYYHGTYEEAQRIFASYKLYRTSDDSLLLNLRAITTRFDSIKAVYPGDVTLHTALDYSLGLRSINPLVQSRRGADVVAHYRKIEATLIHRKPVRYESTLYWTFAENYYTWKSNLKPFSQFEARAGTDYFDRFMGELQLQGNDTVNQIATLYAINSGYKGEGSKRAEVYISLLESIASAPLHPTIGRQATRIQERMAAMALGRIAGDFDIYTSDGDTLALSDFAGKAMVLLDFWFVGCSPCKRDIPELKALHTDFAERLQIIAVNPLEPLDKVGEYRLKHEIPYLMGVPADKEGIKDAFNVRAYPQYVLLQSDGTVWLYAGSEIKDVRNFLDVTPADPARSKVVD